MKRYILPVVVLSLCVLFSGCKKDDENAKDVLENIQSSSVSETETSASTAETTHTKTSKTRILITAPVSQTQPVSDSDSDSTDDSSSYDSSSASAGSDDSSTDSDSNGQSGYSSDIMSVAQAQFEKSCQMQWNLIVDCPYNMDYDNMTGSGAVPIDDSNITSVEDVANTYRTVFETADPVYSKYYDDGDKVYCYDGGRGANIYYTGTDLELVSQSDTELVFNAVSHYSDDNTPERTKTFSMVLEDGVWKTESFSLPY